MPELLPNFRRGDTLTADTINDIIDRQNNPDFDVRGDGIDVRKGVRGQIQLRNAGNSSVQAPFMGVVATGGITARVSGTLGTGTVEKWVKNPSTGVYEDSGIAVKFVDSLSSTIGGIVAGSWVAVGYQEDGTPFVTTSDCGN